MKILMMTNTYTPIIGGVEESIARLSEQFKKKGHEVLVVAPVFKGIPKHEQGVIRIPALQQFNHTDFSVNLPIPGLLWKIVKEFQPDIVHSHHPFLVGDMALRLCGQYDIPLVFTYHTMYEEYLHYIPMRNDLIKRFVIELSSGYADLTDHVIVPSKSVYDILCRRKVVAPIEIIPSGVDIAKFAAGNGPKMRKQLSIPNDAYVIGHVGRLTPEKNLIFLCEAVSEFLVKKSHAHFMVVGKGMLEKEILGIFDRKGLKGRLHMTGFLKDWELVDGYHAMNVFIFSSYTETQGLVLAEAMAAGNPIVAIDAPGVREIINDFENGRMIPRQDQRNFIEALSWCHDRSPEEYEKIKEAARQKAAEYSDVLSAQKVLDIYQSLLSKKFKISEEKHNTWRKLMDRIKTEWEMAKNIVEASEAALLASDEEKEKTLENNHHRESRIIKVRRWLSRNEWSARLLNLKRSNATEAHRGLVLIQIDGFSRKQFEKALRNKRMPFLKRLLRRQHYKVYPFYTGLPSSTPSVQGELFYGVRQVVPAFAFFDKNTRKVRRMYDRESVLLVEKWLAERSSGTEGSKKKKLLAHGSSYSNVYSGGAGETHFCAVKIGWDMLWRGVNPWKLSLLFLTHIFDYLRIALLMFLETVIACIDFIGGILTGENFCKEFKFIPTRTFICILLRELVAMGARMDIARGVPVVHLNFLGYDEQAHRRGPSTPFAHRTLRGIDKVIAKIYGQAIHSTRRNYDVWVYSDHGQEDCESYIVKYGRTVKEAVTGIYKEFTAVSGKNEQEGSSKIQQSSVTMQDHQGVESQRARYISDYFMRRLLSLIGVDNEKEYVRVEEDEGEIVVTAIGPTGNIYLPREMSLPQRDQFAQKLVKEAKIPLVLAPDGSGSVKAWNEKGEFSLPEHAREIIGKDHPYLKEITQDLISVCHHPLAGVFTFMGWRPGLKPLTFPIENGAHAGPGTEETNAFCLLPRDIISSLNDPKYLSTQDLRSFALRFLGREHPVNFVPAANAEIIPKKIQTLRIMTYNVHSCVGMDGKISPERIARIIGQHQPDIVALQELDLMRQRTGGVDQPHMIAKELEMIYHFHSNIRIEKEHYGSAVLSRYPIQMIKSDKLPGLVHQPCLEPRGAIWCSIDLGDRKLQFFNTHLGLRREERLIQARALCGPQWIGHPDCQGPVILCGDFNALPRSMVCRHIRQGLQDAQVRMEGHAPKATWFSQIPMGRIDHVFVSLDVEVVRVEVSSTDLEKKSSDHLPLIVDVRVSGNE